MPTKPVLKEADKQRLRIQLETACEQSWIHHGYMKSSIKELCAGVGISIGTFYSLYPTKEDLFAGTIRAIHERLSEMALRCFS